MIIRDAVEADLQTVLAIHNEAIAGTTAIWDETEVDLENRLAWFLAKRAAGFPVLACEADGRLIGYASFGDFRPWSGYRHTVEHSVYVDRDHRRRGAAHLLLEALIGRADAAGKHVMVAGIEASNAPSIALHAGLGFHAAGRLREVGTKFGRWLDLVFMQRFVGREDRVLLPDRDDRSRGFEIRDDDLSGEQSRALLALHLAGKHADSPPGSVSALDLSGLDSPEVSVWSAWRDGRIAGIGALKMLGADAAEIKSMRTHPDVLRRGAGAAILDRAIATAKARGVRRLSLETGSGPSFEPALALYRRRGFTNGAAFSDYAQSDFNRFLHLDLSSDDGSEGLGIPFR